VQINMDIYRKQYGLPVDRPRPYTNLTDPDLGFVKLAEGFGVQARRITDPDEIAPTVKTALDSGDPWLIDVLTEGEAV
jgi:thiamine pyrophosphate-dependent acetolactate synthase large subunit-like protein